MSTRDVYDARGRDRGGRRRVTSANATVVTFSSARVVFGAGSSAETGEHLRRLGVTRALLVCDPFATASGLGERLEASLCGAGVEAAIYDRIAGEPSESSIQEAAAAARGGYDGFVAVGGGSALDTAKLCALFATHEGELLDYVNAPVGLGKQVPGPVRPLVAVPTTSGTGSEVTTVAVVDFPRLGTKTGISHAHLRPALAIVDPALTVSCPAGVTASTGVDALFHALEAYTVSAFDARPARPLAERPPYQGANPFSDPYCERAIELVGRSLRRAVADGGDIEARTEMALASTLAGLAFGGAGVHVPHALAYPIASLKHEWRPPGYGGAALVPHGFAVAVTAPAAFRFVADGVPERCAKAARLLDGGDDLAASLERLMEDVGAPTHLREIGYGEDDVAAIVRGALDQRRLLVGSPKEVGSAELEAILRASL
jgi:alcohol dehydrogenase class IV